MNEQLNDFEERPEKEVDELKDSIKQNQPDSLPETDMLGENVYQTTDPEKLLQLKRLEAEAILDILKSINNEKMSIKNLCLVVRNLLLTQLQVRKMAFFYESEESWIEGMRLKFSPFSEEAFDEMMAMTTTEKPVEDKQPNLLKLGIEYIIPIYNEGQIKAYFAIADFAESELEEQNDIIFIKTVGNILAVAIRNRELFKEQMARENLQKELEVASTIQKQLLIADFKGFKPMDVYGTNIPHSGVGGDFYDIIKKGEDTLFCCIADVSGKGIGAALLMANLQANLRSLCAQFDDLGTIIGELNERLFSITEGEKFVTMFLARIDLPQKTFSYINAGHNYPILVKGDKISRLSEGCILLGILPDVQSSEKTILFEDGNILLMFTDGVVEQTNKQEEMFGSERIVALVKEFEDLSSQNLVEQLLKRLSDFSEEIEAGDDTTILSVKFSS
ncbi:MAG: serine/threonine-protein phosphatase [Bacteroidia bacterium]|nr:serine/threonine-protein phosphatase [Bacteroidia bacterium]